MRSAKQLLSFILHRRYPRLTFAVFLAVLVHSTLMVTGVLSISWFSAPSDVNRALTITLNSTPIEGLKKSQEEEQETVNEVQKAQAAAPKQETLQNSESIEEPQSSEQAATSSDQTELAQTNEVQKQELTQNEAPNQDIDIAEQVESSTVQTTDLEIDEQAVVLADLIDPSTIDLNTLDTIETETNANTEPQDKQRQANNEPSKLEKLELITATKGLLSLPSVSSNTSVNDQSKPPSIAQAKSNRQFTKRERKVMERKLQRQIRKFAQSEFTKAEINWQHKGQAYIAKMTPMPANDEMLMDQILVDVITEKDGKKLTTTLRLKQLAFSNFAQFIDQWDDRVMMHDDEMNGRFHSNSAFKISSDHQGAPLFHAKATTAANSASSDRPYRRSDVFLAGLETGVKTIRMPKPSVLFETKEQALSGTEKDAQTIVLRENSRLIFTDDGGVLQQALDSAQAMRKYELAHHPVYFIAAPGVALNVRGTVNGLAAIYSPNRITIEGSIRYASRAAIKDGGDFLGLISGRSVYVAKSDIVGVGDLFIDAAIYAKQRFAVRGLRSKGKSADTLSVFGSITSGSISATEPRYATRIDFDPRLENMRPPGFPVTDRFEMVAEELQWQVVEDVYRNDEDDINHELPQLNSELELKQETEADIEQSNRL